MTERNVSRPWTEEEDHLLRQGVNLYGENDNWKNVALLVPNRTNKACRKRWLHSLQPNVKKSAWTTPEDEQLMDLYEKMGPKWSAIARHIPGRTDDACSKRYREALDPNLKKDQWSPEEDQLLLEAYARIGGKWGKVGLELRRSGLGCRNRWRLLERKKASRSSQLSTPEQPTQTPELLPAIEYPQSDNLAAPTEHWPPYYPPEAYPTFTTDSDFNAVRTFREPTPEHLYIPDPKIAPFQFSSSSLSAALSDPPPPPAPLPNNSVYNTPELSLQDIYQDAGETQQSLSPLSQFNGIPEMCDILMSQPGDFPQGLMDPPQMEASITQPAFEDNFNLSRLQDSSFYTSASPIFLTSDLSRTLDPLQFNFWKPRSAPETDFENSPRSTVDNRSVFNDDFSSASSTPFGISTPLSPGSSPWVGTIVDLPTNAEPPSSLLFSSPNDSHSSLLQRTRKHARKSKPSMKASTSTRLSSILALDNNLKPYACGRPRCWPAGQQTSLSCFSTSGELLDHTKDEHAEDEVAEKPYRCALTGCEKSWKSINGLQYHLQISTAHFTAALFSRFSMQQPGTPDMHPSLLSGEEAAEDGEPQRKYPCPHPGCYKAYRQTSGLRYHTKFGHPQEVPTQLPMMPPALERVIPIKAKKLRAKPPPELATV